MKTRNLDVSTLFLITTSLIFSGILTMGSPNLRAQEKYLPLVGEWSYGSCNDVEVVENIAYMGNGTYFQTYDVVDKMNPAFLGEVKLPGIVDQIVIHNNLAFVAIDQDMQIVDISDPENPPVRSTRSTIFKYCSNDAKGQLCLSYAGWLL